MAQAISIKSPLAIIQNTRTHVFMYALLLVATPFILLRNYLVQAISVASTKSFSLFGMELKIIPAIALAVAIILLLIYRKRITRLKILAAAIVIFLDAVAQQVTDYYFGHHYYDLQQNWHYLAYGLFAYVIYRDLMTRGFPLYKIMLITYFAALGVSAFDEFFQKFMSSRVFDICDIGKDVWGTYMGMILIYFSGKSSPALFKDWRKIRHLKFSAYFKHPFTIMVLFLVLSFLFLGIGSLLTETEFAVPVVVLSLIAFALFFMILHYSQFKSGKVIFLAILAVVILTQGYFYFKYRSDNIVYNRYGLTVYKGIPIPFFDVMVFQNGMIRLVDKKHYFNQRDRDFFLGKEPDILLIASGAYGKGGRGFNDPRHEFLYNQWAKKATQVIIQKSPDACETFNRLKKENKIVLFIIHNTC